MTGNPSELAACSGKKAYDSPEQAERYRKSMNKVGKTKARLQVYRCTFCGWWHIGNDWLNRRPETGRPKNGDIDE